MSILSGQLLTYILMFAQQLGLVLGFGAQCILLITYLLGKRDGIINETEDVIAHSIYRVLYISLLIVVVSGVLFTGGFIAMSDPILKEPAFVWKWITIGLAILLAFALKGYRRWNLIWEGISAGNWGALFLLHIFYPIATMGILAELYAEWMLGFLVVWCMLVFAFRESTATQFVHSLTQRAPTPVQPVLNPRPAQNAVPVRRAPAPAPVVLRPPEPAVPALATPQPRRKISINAAALTHALRPIYTKRMRPAVMHPPQKIERPTKPIAPQSIVMLPTTVMTSTSMQPSSPPKPFPKQEFTSPKIPERKIVVVPKKRTFKLSGAALKALVIRSREKKEDAVEQNIVPIVSGIELMPREKGATGSIVKAPIIPQAVPEPKPVPQPQQEQKIETVPAIAKSSSPEELIKDPDQTANIAGVHVMPRTLDELKKIEARLSQSAV